MNASKASKEFVITAMLEPIEVGTQFTMWPLHITLLPWFNAPNIEIVQKNLEAIVKSRKSFQVTVGDIAYFGQRKLPVKLIQNTSELQRLHNDLVLMTSKNKWELPGRYVGDYFKPHVTNKAGREAKGTVVIDALYVFEKLGQGYRKTVAKVGLA